MNEFQVAKAISESDSGQYKYYRMFVNNPASRVIYRRVNELLDTSPEIDVSDTALALLIYPAVKWSLKGKNIDFLLSQVQEEKELQSLQHAQELIRSTIGYSPALLLENRKKYFEMAQTLISMVDEIIEAVSSYPEGGQIYRKILQAFTNNRSEVNKYFINTYLDKTLIFTRRIWGSQITEVIDGLMSGYIPPDEEKEKLYHNISRLLVEYNRILWQCKNSPDKAMRLLACTDDEQMMRITQSDDIYSQGYLIVEFTKLIRASIEIVREFPKRGEIYYQIITSLVEQTRVPDRDIARKLGISSYAFSVKKREALAALGTILWGCDGDLFFELLTKKQT